jgi:hypothetical protein
MKLKMLRLGIVLMILIFLLPSLYAFSMQEAQSIAQDIAQERVKFTHNNLQVYLPVSITLQESFSAADGFLFKYEASAILHGKERKGHFFIVIDKLGNFEAFGKKKSLPRPMLF